MKEGRREDGGESLLGRMADDWGEFRFVSLPRAVILELTMATSEAKDLITALQYSARKISYLFMRFFGRYALSE